MSSPLAPTPRIFVFDKNNVLQDIPPDALTVSASTVINGGSAEGSIVFPRAFANIGALDRDYRVQIYLPDDLSTPWYDGRVCELDRKVLGTRGEVVAYLEGWASALNDAMCTFSVNPGVQANGANNGQMDYGTLMDWMCAQFKPVGFSHAAIGTVGVNVITINASHQPFGQTLDTVTKSILDANGSHWEWYCDGGADMSKNIIVQAVSVNEANPIVLDQYADIVAGTYNVKANYRTIKNMLVIYGGKDASTGEQVWGPFSDSTSINEYGVRQASLSLNELCSQAQLQQYATAQLAQLSQPQYTGGWDMKVATAKARAGKWAVVLEAGASLRTVRLAKVTVSWSKGTVIKQSVELAAPIPRIDKALFDTASKSRALSSAVQVMRPQLASIGQNTTLVSGASLGAFG